MLYLILSQWHLTHNEHRIIIYFWDYVFLVRINWSTFMQNWPSLSLNHFHNSYHQNLSSGGRNNQSESS
jgi:hypothetical protein